MKIDNIELFKKWLVTVLVPIFEGDPEKLAMYIVALSKKVENDQASKERCINDLEVFLETNTNSFVDTLFETLISKSYLTNTNIVDSQSNTLINTNENNSNSEANLNVNTQSQSDLMRRIGDTNRTSNNNANTSRNTSNNNQYKGRSRDYQEIDVSLSSNLVASRSIRTGAHGHSRRRKNRSRNRLHRDSSSSSSSSPTTISSSSRRYDRNRSRSYSSRSRSRSNSPKDHSQNNENNKKQRCRDFDEQGFCKMAELCPYDHGEVIIAPLVPPMSNASNNNNNSIQNQPPSSSHHQQSSMNNNNQNFNNNNYNNQRGNNMKRRNQQQQQYQPQRFNKNFNQQGLQTIQGQQQQQPVNLLSQNSNEMLFNRQQGGGNGGGVVGPSGSGINRPRNLVSIPTGQPPPGNMMIMMQEQHQMEQHSMNMSNNFINQQQQQPRGMKRMYNNNNNNNNQSFIPNQGPPPSIHGALLPTPNVNSQLNQQVSGGGAFQQQSHLQPTTLPHQQTTPSPQSNTNDSLTLHQPIINQFPQPPPPIPQNQQPQQQTPNANTTLIVKKVPIDLNRVDKMQQHFSKFGQLVEIQCQYEQMSDAALIKFATNPQAFAAYKCPQPVFNNRFIRLYWLNSYQKQQQQQQQQPHHQISNSNQKNQHQYQQGSNVSASDEPPLKKLARDRLDYSKNPHAQSLNKENQQSNREVILIGNNNTNDSTEDGGVDSDVITVSTTNANSLDSTNEKKQNLSSNFNAQLSLRTAAGVDAAAAALAAKKSNYEKFAATRLLQDENHKKTLLLKMEVQQKARELIEKQIKDQKLLLQKFEQAKTVEEKSLILSLVKKLSESIEKEKGILSNNKKVTPQNNKNTILGATPAIPTSQPVVSATLVETDLVEKTPDTANNGSSSPSIFNNISPFSYQKVNKMHQHAISIPPPPHHLKLNNKRLNNTNFLKHGNLSGAASANISNSTSPASMTMTSAFSFSRVSVDNRPKSLLITCLESNGQEKNQIVNFINSLGCQIENVFDYQIQEGENSSSISGIEEASVADNTKSNSSKSFVICFLTRKDAEVALAKCVSSLTSKSITLTWFKQSIEALAKLEASKKAEDDSLTASTSTEVESLVEKKTQENKIESAELNENRIAESTSINSTPRTEVKIIKEITESNIKELINSVSNDDDDESDAENVNEYENENEIENNETNDSESNVDSIMNLIKNSRDSLSQDIKCDENDDVFDGLFGKQDDSYNSKNNNDTTDLVEDENTINNSNSNNAEEQFEFDQ